ncbi:MAG: FprA family A-type flavoprotein [Desulfurococcaceae archaeon]
MSKLRALRISESAYWVGARDISRRMFDALIPLPRGTSYNAYIVVGSNKTALIDTVNPGFEADLIERASSATDLSKLDYVVMNHAEPDHAGSIPIILEKAPNAKLVTTQTGAKLAKLFYNVSESRIQVVRNNDTISLGNKTLQFIEAPMLHWPETMFTYLIEDRVLFPCDFFGAHLAQGFWDSDVDDLLEHAKRYFGEIMMPFRSSALSALRKLSSLNIEVIAPSHGPIYRNPSKIIDMYWKWSSGKTERKVLILYTSMWHYTEKAVKLIADELLSSGIQVVVHNLEVADLGEVAKDLVDSRGIVLATPTVIGGAHPLIVYGTYLAKLLRSPTKYAFIVNVYAWGTGADKQLVEMLKDTGLELTGIVKVNVTLTDGDIENLRKHLSQLADKVKSEK